MSLIDRLEKAAKKYDSRARRSAVADNYDWGAADLREMLQEAIAELKGWDQYRNIVKIGNRTSAIPWKHPYGARR